MSSFNPPVCCWQKVVWVLGKNRDNFIMQTVIRQFDRRQLIRLWDEEHPRAGISLRRTAGCLPPHPPGGPWARVKLEPTPDKFFPSLLPAWKNLERGPAPGGEGLPGITGDSSPDSANPAVEPRLFPSSVSHRRPFGASDLPRRSAQNRLHASGCLRGSLLCGVLLLWNFFFFCSC